MAAPQEPLDEGAADAEAGSEGALLVRQGGPWYRLRWRRDDGVTPALLTAEPA